MTIGKNALERACGTGGWPCTATTAGGLCADFGDVDAGDDERDDVDDDDAVSVAVIVDADGLSFIAVQCRSDSSNISPYALWMYQAESLLLTHY